MNSRPVRLSVGIPTYNRSASLERTLGMLIEQIGADDAAAVEILISDNCSSDDTEAVATRYAAQYGYIKYHRHTTNCGPDRNFDAAVYLSAGEFVWILADDDWIDGRAIREIVGAIAAHPDVDLVFLNYALYKDDFKTLVSSSRARAETSGVAIDGNDFYLKTLFANSFISANVVRRSSWMNAKPEQYYDTAWIHLHVARDILANGKAYIIRDWMVRQGWDEGRLRRKSTRDYNLHIEVFCEFAKFIHQLPEKGFDDRVFRLGKRVLKGEELRQIVFLKIAVDAYRFQISHPSLPSPAHVL